MAKEVVWTEASVKDRFFIDQFWLTHNQSNSYNEKLELLFDKAARTIATFPQAGTKTNVSGVRVKIVVIQDLLSRRARKNCCY